MSYTHNRYGGYLDSHAYWVGHVRRNILRHVSIDAGGSVLDFGCGAGRGTAVLADHLGVHVLGVDSDVTQISAALQLPTRDNLEFLKVDDGLLWLDARTELFDLIVLDNVLEHIPPIAVGTVLSHLGQRLADNGVLLIVTPNAASVEGLFLRYDDPTHWVLYTENSLRLVMEQSGFRDVIVHKYESGGRLARRKLIGTVAIMARLMHRIHGYRVLHSGPALVCTAMWSPSSGSVG